MKLFKKKISKEKVEENRLAKGITHLYKRIQTTWAKWMEQRTSGLSRNNWIVMLALFVTVAGGFSVYRTASSFWKDEKSISIIPIAKPRHLSETGEAKRSDVPRMPEEQSSRIQKFSHYMDSISRTSEGKIVYDSIASRHPGLLDSIKMIEKYYQLK